MNSDPQTAKNKIELVELMRSNLPYDSQPRDQMRAELELAKAHIDMVLDTMDTVDEQYSDD